VIHTHTVCTTLNLDDRYAQENLRSEAAGVEKHEFVGSHSRRAQSQVLQAAQERLVRLLDLVETVAVQHGELRVGGGDDCPAVDPPAQKSQFACQTACESFWTVGRFVGGGDDSW
jgi:hypothetical protein